MWDRIVLLPVALIIGMVMGSFYNVLIYRLPRKISIIDPKRSFCPICGHQLAWKDNIPLISYLILKGRCRYCAAAISVRYPIVEMLTASLFTLAIYLTNNMIDLFSLWIFFSAAIVASAIDFEYMLIPDSAVIVTGIGGLLWSWHHGHITLSLITAAFAFGIFLLIYLLSKGGMGFGDVEYFGVLALFLTPFSAVMSVLIASVVALAYALPQVIVHKAGRKTRVPFGPFLAIGTTIAMLLNFHLFY